MPASGAPSTTTIHSKDIAGFSNSEAWNEYLAIRYGMRAPVHESAASSFEVGGHIPATPDCLCITSVLQFVVKCTALIEVDVSLLW